MVEGVPHPILTSSQASMKHKSEKLGVWCWLPEEKWECAKIHSASANNAQVLMPSGKILMLPSEKILMSPSEKIMPANSVVQDNVNDLALLCYVNEPSILHCLKYRYSQDMIYSNADPVLVALNPFKDLSIQENKSVAACLQKVGEIQHVFAVVDWAFNEILRGGKIQSIILSGESNSGKTETAKIAMQHLFALGSGGIDFEILMADTILESFGNAKTFQNDNSGRFSRVVQRAVEERSFHVFYQLCAGAPLYLKRKLNLRTANEYELLKQSRCLKVDSIDDSHKFHLLMEALDTFHITEGDKKSSMLAAVLWLGNIGFTAFNSENQVEFNLDEAVASMENLLGCEVNALVLALSTQTSYSRNETVVQKLTLSKAVDARDALAKSIYAALFDWVAVQINKSLHAGKIHRGSSISILDACGFDVSHKNGFDEFCSSYASEKMQQYFNSHLLKYEQELATLESARACKLQGILCIQKYFRGARARCIFNDVKNGATTLQTFIRAVRARNEFHYLAKLHRAAVLIQMHFKRWVAQKAYSKQQKLIMLLQSVIRGWLARKHFNIGRNLEMKKCNNLNLHSDQRKKLHELEQDHSPLQDSDWSELKRRALKAEAELRHKEEENCCLYQKLQQYETRWSDYDAKMKHLEEMWQKQMTSLQISLAVAQRSLASNDVVNLAGRPDVSPNYPYFDSEDAMSVETFTTEGTPVKQRASGLRPNRTPEALRNTISHLVKEFEERRQIFEDDAGFLVEVKAGLSVSNLNPHEELSKLKVRFASWKKNYKVRLREVKAALQKIRNSETGKKRRKWWGFWSSK
ncbi:myosin-1-like isoform X2 [Phalaenopsis equestris]|uniref:myosin-1-like isoform X2 n=1 Tax=Phalaenopsis equestris TaxID=78828 RepID=UPI0009E4CEA4|nr:myosin-1-like isoform X2 [Phalaenopsis equestris]